MLAFDEAHVIGICKVIPHAPIGVVAGHTRDRRRGGSADPTPNDNGAGITSFQKHNVRGHWFGGSVDTVCVRPCVPHGRDIHETGRKNVRFFQAEGFGDVVGDGLEIRVAPAAASPWVDPQAIVPGDVCIE